MKKTGKSIMKKTGKSNEKKRYCVIIDMLIRNEVDESG